ncbi:MAG: sugar phosphate isomerase/epimerase [Acidobacteria bacterium]|nr:sugar phosphate isomerase/epimerase [Acidobacteriota bacterium]
MIYGVSTHVVARENLTGDHLDRIAAAGFDTVELFANSHQIDFDNPGALRDITGAIDRNRLFVNSVHAPFYASLEELYKGHFLDISSTDEDLRALSVSEIIKSFILASYVNVDYFVLHFPGTENRDALMKSIDELHSVSEQIRTKLSFENVPGPDTGVSDIVKFLDENQIPFGVCFDIGHSHLAGRVLKDIEEYAVHFYTAHIHDNDGIHDIHQLPFDGTIPWTEVMAAFRKADYKWGFMLEIKRPENVPLNSSLAQMNHIIPQLESLSKKAVL